MPRIESRLQYVEAVQQRGEDFFRVVCEHDLEGVVAKPQYGSYYSDGLRTNWLKIKDPNYSQMAGREGMFVTPDPWRRGGKRKALELMLPVGLNESPCFSAIQSHLKSLINR